MGLEMKPHTVRWSDETQQQIDAIYRAVSQVILTSSDKRYVSEVVRWTVEMMHMFVTNPNSFRYIMGVLQERYCITLSYTESKPGPISVHGAADRARQGGDQ